MVCGKRCSPGTHRLALVKRPCKRCAGTPCLTPFALHISQCRSLFFILTALYLLFAVNQWLQFKQASRRPRCVSLWLPVQRKPTCHGHTASTHAWVEMQPRHSSELSVQPWHAAAMRPHPAQLPAKPYFFSPARAL